MAGFKSIEEAIEFARGVATEQGWGFGLYSQSSDRAAFEVWDHKTGHIQSFEVRPVVAAVIRVGHGLPVYSDLAVDQHGCLIAIVHTFQVGDDGFALAFSFRNRRGLPLSLLFQVPAIVFEDRFSRLGVGKHLDPTLYTKQA